MDAKKFLKRFVISACLLFLIIGGIVYLVDPFYHYHAPVKGLKAVVTKPEYQCIGTVRNLEYDSIVLGSSVAENYNNHWFDEAYSCTTIKGIQKSAETVDLLYYLEQSYQGHELKNVFYSLDLPALCADSEKTFPDETLPLYLFDQNVLNDVKYLWNKDVLLEDVPYMIAMSFLGDYDEGESYNWWQYKTFSEEGALWQYQYTYLEEVAEPVAQEEYKPLIDANIDLIEECVKAHPETMFRFIYPPYSKLRWDEAYRGGVLESFFYATQASMERLLPYENVELYYFQNEEEVICDLNNYMDTVHFSQEINHWIVKEMAQKQYLITEENKEEQIQKMKMLVQDILQEMGEIQ